MKKYFTIAFTLFVIVYSLCSCSQQAKIQSNTNVVYTNNANPRMETYYSDDDPVKLINTADLIVRATLTEAEEPYYGKYLAPICIYKYKITEIINNKSTDFSVGDTVSVIDCSGYIPFKTYISQEDNDMTVRYALTDEEYDNALNNENACVAIVYREGQIPEENCEYVLLLYANTEKGVDTDFVLWSARSSVIKITDNNKLEGYATSFFGDTYEDFTDMVNTAKETPDVKYR